MATQTFINKSEQLKKDLAQAEWELEHAYDALSEAENKVWKIKNKIEELKKSITTESLPSHLYYAGYKLQQDIDSKSYKLLNANDDVLKEWNFNPSLSDLMEIPVVSTPDKREG